MVLLPGADRVLAAQGAAVPQADQTCGPFAARAALHALAPAPLAAVPSLAGLARHCGTRLWPHDDPDDRPPGEPPVDPDGTGLPRAGRPGEGGTDAPGFRRGVEAATGGAVAVVSAAAAGTRREAAAALGRLLADLTGGPPVGVVAHVRTGPVTSDPARAWDVGHFVCVFSVEPAPEPGYGVAPPDRVGLADSYASLGEPGQPPGCRTVDLADLAEAMRLPPGRGLLLLVPAADREAVTARVRGTGLDPAPWTA